MTSQIKPTIKVVLFDHDDTLVETLKAKIDEHKHIARKFYGKDLQDAEILRHWGKPFSDLIRLLYETDDIDQAIAYNLDSHKDFPKLLPDDTISTLTYLKKIGKKIGVVTAANVLSFNYDLKSLGIPRELFDYIQTERDTSFHKPNPKVFEPAVKWLNQQYIKPSEVVYVGDGLHDMKAALGAGFEFIGVTTGLVTQTEFKKNGAKTTIKKLSELTKI